MTIEFRIGYNEALGDMVYDVFKENPHLIKEPYVLLDREKTKHRLETLMAWVVGAYYGDIPVAAMWGRDNEIQWVADSRYRKRWMTKGLMKQFYSFFFSKYDTMKAQTYNVEVERMLRRIGFEGPKNNMVKVK